ncbi:hypothetical protein EYF80_018161 [Liparis tanakae]|uniref:Uncharacterized protein n=1 Tax=Liparis tanakae TaxID=230148 RepID=A0A4Z2I0R8_9TELE|nr:hypothetical protein EYF80_018161 [Liparis tanakae]
MELVGIDLFSERGAAYCSVKEEAPFWISHAALQIKYQRPPGIPLCGRCHIKNSTAATNDNNKSSAL